MTGQFYLKCHDRLHDKPLSVVKHSAQLTVTMSASILFQSSLSLWTRVHLTVALQYEGKRGLSVVRELCGNAFLSVVDGEPSVFVEIVTRCNKWL